MLTVNLVGLIPRGRDGTRDGYSQDFGLITHPFIRIPIFRIILFIRALITRLSVTHDFIIRLRRIKILLKFVESKISFIKLASTVKNIRGYVFQSYSGNWQLGHCLRKAIKEVACEWETNKNNFFPFV
jgi:hypothetical protein